MAQHSQMLKSPVDFTTPMGDAKSTMITCNKRGSGPVRLIFTHGAGGSLTTDGLVNFSVGFVESNQSSIVCFQGNINLKARTKMFDFVHDRVIKKYDHETPLALGGSSMGARAAVLAALPHTKCLIMASYPLHTDKDVRDQILLDLPPDKDVLFISGDNDSMCDLKRLDDVRAKMKAQSWMIRVRDAAHGLSMKPKKATRPIGEYAGQRALQWLVERNEEETACEIWWGEDENGRERVHGGPWEAKATAKAEKSQATKENLAKHDKSKAKPPKPSKPAKAESIEENSSKPQELKESLSATTKPRESKRRKVARR